MLRHNGFWVGNAMKRQLIMPNAVWVSALFLLVSSIAAARAQTVSLYCPTFSMTVDIDYGSSLLTWRKSGQIFGPYSARITKYDIVVTNGWTISRVSGDITNCGGGGACGVIHCKLANSMKPQF